VHELTLAVDLLELTERHAHASGLVQVLRVHLALGALAPVDEEALGFAFEVARRGTVAESAELHIERVPGRASCQSCRGMREGTYEPGAGEVADATFPVDARGVPCPSCGSFAWKLVEGDELRLTGLEGV
jgi:hydrogenase nickel incorporation protein HypA/HybF